MYGGDKMKAVIIGAGSDLGVHIDGAHLGPLQLMNDMKPIYHGEMINLMQDEGIVKSRNLSDRKKNDVEIERFNTALYKLELKKMKEGLFPLTLGGDHSVAVASALADSKINDGHVGMIWIDAHTDYNTFETTVSGNIHGLPCAAITGWKCEELRTFFDGQCIDPRKTVIIGARSIDPWEEDNIKYSGVTVYSTEDIKKMGIKTVVDEAFKIALDRNKSVHVSYDIDVVDPDFAPGVSIPEVDGINDKEAMEILEEVLKHINSISSMDIVEFNPLRDEDRKTEQLALSMVARTVQMVEEVKGKIINQKKY